MESLAWREFPLGQLERDGRDTILTKMITENSLSDDLLLNQFVIQKKTRRDRHEEKRGREREKKKGKSAAVVIFADLMFFGLINSVRYFRESLFYQQKWFLR